METAKRNPDGLAKQKPIALRLMPDELDKAAKIADQFSISRSFLARRAFLAGLDTVVEELSPAADGGISGGEETFPTGLSESYGRGRK